MSFSMSKGKIRSANDVCADCGALDPAWASVNRGILLCDECCGVHRSLGRHVSQVASLRKGCWSPALLRMVHALNDNGVNNIWEHGLLESSHVRPGRRKPHAKDPLHPTKAEFIRAKHQMLSFLFRGFKDDTVVTEEDLSRQLHSSVRTSNLETSLRLLIQGADPNYFHDEKGTAPLHVAARAGQPLQVELLVVYGADPGVLSAQGATPAEVARAAGHKEIAERLCECVYELTDRLAYFLCARRPDHPAGQHYIVPELSDSLAHTETAKAARKKLQQLPNHLFEELAMDVYDEVDRRETEAIWLSAQQPADTPGHERCAVPFLPVNPEFSTTRNQGRQKLARFSAREFANLVIDVLAEAKRRQSPTASVALPQDERTVQDSRVARRVGSLVPGKKDASDDDDEPLYDCVASDDDYLTPEEIARLAQKVGISSLQPREERERSQTLETAPSQEAETSKASPPVCQNGPVENKLKVQNLVRENAELRGFIERAGLAFPAPSPLPNGHAEAGVAGVTEPRAGRAGSQRPTSMYEPREGLFHRGAPASRSSKWDKRREAPGSAATHSLCHCAGPGRADVVRCTDQVTKRVQELWASTQGLGRGEGFAPCADRVREAVQELTALFSQAAVDEDIRAALTTLAGSAARLQAECTGAVPAADKSCFLQQVRSCAYDIAKATKHLVTRCGV
ncbi:ARF GTPase-activating protein GIT1 isoform X2 [Bacillus rossius redtenbacheri]|uniref:ARF GTPase-activating protein GIT1 isoform X2 n=1 Tax=Bacillus rossius redtenbacheri TaxID=93214 RepID=UPI002FDD8C89